MYWIIGNQGMLGKELEHLFDIYGVSYIGSDKEIDTTKAEELEKQKACFDWVINCAAYTAVDKAEEDKDLCYALNVEGPLHIAEFARKRYAKMVHISTDYVFNGNSKTPYHEDDPTSPIGFYGKTKLEGEQAVRKYNGYVIRTSWLYGRYGNNFVKTMLNLMNVCDTISVVNDQIGSPTWAYNLAQFIYTFTQKINVCDGVYHYSNKGEISWYDFAVAIYKLGCEYGLIRKDCAIVPCSTSEYPTKAERPKYSVLDTSKIARCLEEVGEKIPQWDISLMEFLKGF